MFALLEVDHSEGLAGEITSQLLALSEGDILHMLRARDALDAQVISPKLCKGTSPLTLGADGLVQLVSVFLKVKRCSHKGCPKRIAIRLVMCPGRCGQDRPHHELMLTWRACAGCQGVERYASVSWGPRKQQRAHRWLPLCPCCPRCPALPRGPQSQVKARQVRARQDLHNITPATSILSVRQDRFREASIAYFGTKISASGSGIVIWPMLSSPA